MSGFNFTVRYLRAWRLTAKNKLLSPPMKAIVTLESNKPRFAPDAFDHSDSSGYWLEHFCGWLSHRMHPSAPVPEQLRYFTTILPLLDSLQHQPHLLGHARHTPFQGRRIQLRNFSFRPVRPVLEPHPPNPIQQTTLPGIGAPLGCPDLVVRIYNIRHEAELVELYSSVLAVGIFSLGIGRTHVDGNVLVRLRIAAMPQQFLSRYLPDRSFFLDVEKSIYLAIGSANP